MTGIFIKNQVLRKSIIDIGVTLKQIAVETCNFQLMFFLEFSIVDNIFKIFLIFLSYL